MATSLSSLFFWAGLALTFLTGFLNLGIIAIDDYNHGFAVMIPAQNPIALSSLTSGVHPYLPKFLLRAIAQFFYGLGISDPLWQLRCSLALLGTGVYLSLQACVRQVFPTGSLERVIAIFLVGFYFLLPLFSTRPLIETLCLPLLTWSGVWVGDYAATGKKRGLIYGLFFLATASLMRFQAGVCALGLVALILYRKNWKDLGLFLIASGVLFLATGVPDIFFRGRFHDLLWTYVNYNLSFAGAHFGKMPFYTFLVLIIALSLPPTFISRYRGLNWISAYRRLIGPVLYVVVFVVAHSLSPHKEDRFIVPILPLYLFALVPLAAYLWRKGSTWRRAWFLGANLVLLVLTCSNTTQNNLISLAKWVSTHPETGAVDSLNGSLVFFPQAFLLQSIEWTNHSAAQVYSNQSCDRLAVVRRDVPLPADWGRHFRQVAVFNPGWIDGLLAELNPKNARRGALVGYIPLACP